MIEIQETDILAVLDCVNVTIKSLRNVIKLWKRSGTQKFAR